MATQPISNMPIKPNPSKSKSTVTTTTSTPNATRLVEGAAKEVTQQAGNLAKGAAQSLNQAVSTANESINTATSTVKDIASKGSSIVDGVVDTINTAASGISNAINTALSLPGTILGASIEAISSGFNNVISKFTKPSDLVATVSNIEQDQGPKEAQSKVKELSSDSGEAIAKPVAFVSKPISDVMKGTSTGNKGGKEQDLTQSMSSGSLSNLSKATGSLLKTSSDISNAIRGVTSNLANGISSTIGSITNGTGSIANDILSPIGEIKNTLSEYVTAGMNLASAVTEPVRAVMEIPTTITNSVIGALPPEIQGLVGPYANNFVHDQMNNILGGKLDSINHILSLTAPTKLDNNQVINSFLNIQGYGSGTSYPQYINKTSGGTFSTAAGTAKETITGLYSIAKTICDGVDMPEFWNYRNNKDLYDILADLAASLGLSDLLNQLGECTGTDYDYFDERTKKVLGINANNSAKRGDVSTFKTITGILGAANMISAERNVITLNANMQATTTNKKEYKEVLDQHGYTTQDLITSAFLQAGTKTRSDNNIRVYSGSRIAVMTATQNDVVDEAIGSDIRKLSQAAMLAYAA